MSGVHKRLPLLENCDQSDPKDAFQWAFVSLPFTGSTPLLVQPEARAEWSELFWDLGFRHHPELMTKELRQPYRGQQHALNGTVRTVEAGSDEPNPAEVPDPAEFTVHEQELMIERLRQLGRLPEPNPEKDLAEVEERELFNPADHSPSTVNGYLMGVSEAERRRVIAAEMTGKRRDQVLRKWRGV